MNARGTSLVGALHLAVVALGCGAKYTDLGAEDAASATAGAGPGAMGGASGSSTGGSSGATSGTGGQGTLEGSPDGPSCGPHETLVYDRPGCGTDAPAPRCQGPGDACLSIVCDCNGQTTGDGCGWATFPFGGDAADRAIDRDSFCTVDSSDCSNPFDVLSRPATRSTTIASMRKRALRRRTTPSSRYSPPGAGACGRCTLFGHRHRVLRLRCDDGPSGRL